MVQSRTGFHHKIFNSSSFSLQVEYLVVAVDDAAKKARLSLAQADILNSLAKDEELWKAGIDSKGQTVGQ